MLFVYNIVFFLPCCHVLPCHSLVFNPSFLPSSSHFSLLSIIPTFICSFLCVYSYLFLIFISLCFFLPSIPFPVKDEIHGNVLLGRGAAALAVTCCRSKEVVPGLQKVGLKLAHYKVLKIQGLYSHTLTFLSAHDVQLSLSIHREFILGLCELDSESQVLNQVDHHFCCWQLPSHQEQGS